MFTITTENNINTYVKFYYEKAGTKKVTTCIIEAMNDKEERKVLGTGKAFCNKNDNFNKSTGRKLALLRALKDAGINKEDRKKFFWDKYFETIGHH